MRESKRYRVRNVRIYHTLLLPYAFAVRIYATESTHVLICFDTIRSLSDLVVVMYARVRSDMYKALSIVS